MRLWKFTPASKNKSQTFEELKQFDYNWRNEPQQFVNAEPLWDLGN